ncbi:MAG: hypothetical protein NW205_04820 [Hyphomicrobiaceae bacterium]|nr:hypothetical protein [Hyphomicrobiaceae bacterium]
MRRTIAFALAAACAVIAAALVPGVDARAQDKQAAAEYSEQGLLDAAYDHCATKENRGVKSCDCEQKLLSQPDRLDDEGKRMAFWYWTDQDRFKKEFEARRQADPKWQEGFALKMANWSALVTAACGS